MPTEIILPFAIFVLLIGIQLLYPRWRKRAVSGKPAQPAAQVVRQGTNRVQDPLAALWAKYSRQITIGGVVLILIVFVIANEGIKASNLRAYQATQSGLYTATPDYGDIPAHLSGFQALCKQASSSLAADDIPSLPLLVLIKAADETSWRMLSHQDSAIVVMPDLETRIAAEVRSVACVLETFVQVGSYSDGAPAYRVDWQVTLMAWPGGEWIDSTILEGEDPPRFKEGTQSGYGNTPYRRLPEWLAQVTSK